MVVVLAGSVVGTGGSLVGRVVGSVLIVDVHDSVVMVLVAASVVVPTVVVSIVEVLIGGGDGVVVDASVVDVVGTVVVVVSTVDVVLSVNTMVLTMFPFKNQRFCIPALTFPSKWSESQGTVYLTDKPEMLNRVRS